MTDLAEKKDIKQVNRTNTFQYIYQNPGVTKQEISYGLHLSLPTVTMNLTDFMEEGLILSDELAESSVGRRAKKYRVNSIARYAIGVDIWEKELLVVVADLYGNAEISRSYPFNYEKTEACIDRVAELVMALIEEQKINHERVLGISVSLQGVISADGEEVIYGDAMNTTGITRELFASRFPFPCVIVRNVEAAAAMEIWTNPDFRDGTYLMLNTHFGGTIIVNSSVYRSATNYGGTIEHMCLVPDGQPCYCGKRGCVETYCSVASLREAAGEELPDFFLHLRDGDPKENLVWNNYLRKLALLVDNIRMVWGNQIILGGYLIHFMTEEDVATLEAYIHEQSAFRLPEHYLKLSTLGGYSSANGATLGFIKRFLDSI